MTSNRRRFLKTMGFGAVVPFTTKRLHAGRSMIPGVRPKRLSRGDMVGLVSPAGHITDSQLYETIDQMTDLGLRVKYGKHALSRYGYLAGKDEERADDFNRMIADPEVDAIIALRGGWGCNRILELIDYGAVRDNPKIVMGYSDITSLLIALYTKTGLVTFHGPVGISSWNRFTLEHVDRVLFQGQAAVMRNNDPPHNRATEPEVITRGRSEGVLVGGNLSVLTSMIGSPFVPEWRDTILFLEEIDEDVYRVDRLLTQLKIAGVLRKISGFIFGSCSNCSRSDSGSLSLRQVLRDHIAPLGVPAWYGSMFGHISDKFTVPVGARARIDTDTCSISLVEPAVSI